MRLFIVLLLYIFDYNQLRTLKAESERTQLNGFHEDPGSETFVVHFWRGLIDNSSDWTPQGRTYITDKRYLWPNARIPYYIDESVNKKLRERIHTYVDFFNRKTCVKWVYGGRHERDYVIFKYGHMPCWSVVGRTGGEQHINLNNACIKDVGHEMMHAMGFIHEHARVDRDCYIAIRQDMVHNNHNYQHYRRINTDTKYPYDYNSIMHYPANFGQNPIIWGVGPYGKGKSIGPLSKGLMTTMDEWKVNTLYCNKKHYCETHKQQCNEYAEYEKRCFNGNYGK